MLKKYEGNQKSRVPKPKEPSSSGVACTEPKCKGEMMVYNPRESHPELKELRRASCKVCGWRGWV